MVKICLDPETACLWTQYPEIRWAFGTPQDLCDWLDQESDLVERTSGPRTFREEIRSEGPAFLELALMVRARS